MVQFLDPEIVEKVDKSFMGSNTQFASTSELEKVTMPIDGSANSLNILLTALTDGILDMVGTEKILVMFFRR